MESEGERLSGELSRVQKENLFSQLRQYRLDREKREQKWKRYDDRIYVCPFAGFLDSSKTGCMIHPLRTGISGLQNVSFYGETICQSYNCPAQEKPDATRYLDLVEKYSTGFLSYGRFVSDTLFYTAWKQEQNITESGFARQMRARQKSPEHQSSTSFVLEASKLEVSGFSDLTDRSQEIQ